MNCEFGERETGFINSQPSLAECLTSFGPRAAARAASAVGDAFQSSSIKNSTLSLAHATLIPPPFEQTIPSLNPGASSHPRHSRPKHSLGLPGTGTNGACPLPTAASLPPEYPWMKEKKAAKRNQLAPPHHAQPTHDTTGPLYFSPQGNYSSIWLIY